MDKTPENTWWIDYLDTSKEQPEHVRVEYASEADAMDFYNQLMS